MGEPYHKFHLDNWTDADFAGHPAATRATIELTLTQKAELDRLRAERAIEPPHVSIHDDELLVEWFGRVIIVVNDEGAACCFIRQGHYVPHTAVDWPTALAELRRLIDSSPVGGMEVE